MIPSPPKKTKRIEDNTPIMSISVAADLLGLHIRTLMLYEFEKIHVPKRNAQNRRMYSTNDIKRLRFILYLTRRKKVNLAGIRYVLQIIEKAENLGLDVKKELFADYKEEL